MKLSIELTYDQFRIAKALALLKNTEFDEYASSLFVDMLSIEIERHFDGDNERLQSMYKAIGRHSRA